MFGIFRKRAGEKSQKIKWADTMKWEVLDGHWFVELYLYEDGSREISISDKDYRSLINYRDFNEVRIISDELKNLVDWLEMMIESEGLDKLQEKDKAVSEAIEKVEGIKSSKFRSYFKDDKLNKG